MGTILGSSSVKLPYPLRYSDCQKIVNDDGEARQGGSRKFFPEGVTKFSGGDQAASVQYDSHWQLCRTQTRLAITGTLRRRQRAPRAFRCRPNVLACPSTGPLPMARPFPRRSARPWPLAQAPPVAHRLQSKTCRPCPHPCARKVPVLHPLYLTPSVNIRELGYTLLLETLLPSLTGFAAPAIILPALGKQGEGCGLLAGQEKTKRSMGCRSCRARRQRNAGHGQANYLARPQHQ